MNRRAIRRGDRQAEIYRRLKDLADSYGDLDGGKVRERALWEASEAYRNLHDAAGERRVLQRLVQEVPQSPHRSEAEARLRQLPAGEPSPPPKAPSRLEPLRPGGATQPPNTNLPEPTSTPPRPSPTPQEPQPAQPGGTPSEGR